MDLTERKPLCPWHIAGPCGGIGGALLLLSLFKTLGLDYPSGGFFVWCALVLLAALAFFISAAYRYPLSTVVLCLLPIGLFVFVRVFCLDHVTYDFQDFLSPWAQFFRDNGGWAAIKLPKGNYNVPYLYFLAAASYLDQPDLYLIKLFSILFDVLLAWGGLRLARVLCPEESARPLVVFSLLLVLPTVVLNGSYWAQCDSIYGALCFHALASGLERRPWSSVVLLALAFSFKLQTVFLMPLWCVLWFSGRLKFRHLLAFPATYAASILPALLLGKPLKDILGVYFGQAVEYSDYLTMNAPSIYALIPYGAQVNTALLSKVGIFNAFLFTLAVLLVLFLHRGSLSNGALLTAGILFAVGIPLLLPHMHDRYFFLADVLTLTWACLNVRRIPHAAAVQIASLGAYHAYLRLQYAFPMAWGTLLLIAILLSSAVVLWGELRPAGKSGRSAV